MKISAVVPTYNEEKNIPDLIKNLKDCDEIIIADGGSTDRTRELAKGAKVFVRSDHTEKITADDIERFKERYGWTPSFTEATVIQNMGKARTEAIFKAKHDWVFMPDADERVTWDIKEVKKEMKLADQIACDFVHQHNPDGTPKQTFNITKLFKKEKYFGRVHEVLIPHEKVLKSKHMRIDHWQKEGHTQPQVLPTLEYSVIKENTPRDRFYLGREYYYRSEYEKAVKIFDEYLFDATWLAERTEAILLKARCYWMIATRRGLEGDNAMAAQFGQMTRDTCYEAVKLNPDHRETLYFMSEIHFEPWKHKWLKMAQEASNEDSVF